MSPAAQTHTLSTGEAPASHGVGERKVNPRRVVVSHIAGYAIAIVGVVLLLRSDTNSLTSNVAQAGYVFVAAMFLVVIGLLLNVGVPGHYTPPNKETASIRELTKDALTRPVISKWWIEMLYVNAGLLVIVSVFLLVR